MRCHRPRLDDPAPQTAPWPAILGLSLLAAGCASTPDRNGELADQPECDRRASCFDERAVRDVRVLDDTTVLVFVGRNRCPYRITVDGFFCDLRMSPMLEFRDADGRICRVDRAYVIGGPFAREDEVCRIRDVKPLNDDELLETYVSHGIVQPPPPTEPAALEVLETPSDAAAAPVDEAAPPPADRPADE